MNRIIPIRSRSEKLPFLIAVLYLIGPVFNSIHPILDAIFWVSTLLVIYYVIVLRRIQPGYLKYFLVLFLVHGYMLVSISFYELVSTSDYIQVGLKPLRIYITVFGGWILSFIYYTRGYSFQTVLKHMYFAIGLHAVVMIVQFLNPTFKDFVYSYTTNIASAGIENYYYEYNFRMGGWAGGFGSATLSVSQSIGLLFIPFLLKDRSVSQKVIIYLLAVLIASSVLLSGRSGVLCCLLFLPLSIYMSGGRNIVVASTKVIFAVLVLVFIMYLLIDFVSDLPAQSELSSSLSRSIDTLINFQETGTYSDNTVNTLVGHIKFPNDLVTFVLGDGEHLVNTQFGRTLSSDIGYIRNLWSFGLLVSLMFWWPALYFLFVAFQKMRYQDSAKILFIVTLVTLFFQFKEAFLYSRILLSYSSLLLGYMYIEIYFGDRKRDIESPSYQGFSAVTQQ